MRRTFDPFRLLLISVAGWLGHTREVPSRFRMKGKNGIGRAIYMAATGQRLVVLHAFIKKTAKTPRSAIRTALERAKGVV